MFIKKIIPYTFVLSLICNHFVQATTTTTTTQKLMPCSRFIQANGVPVTINTTSIARHLSPEDLENCRTKLMTSVTELLKGTWHLSSSDFQTLEDSFTLFFSNLEDLGESKLSEEEKNNRYNAALDTVCQSLDGQKTFVTKEWLKRYQEIAYKCIPKPEDAKNLTEEARLNITLMVRFHFVIPASWIGVLIDTALRTDPEQMHRFFYEEATVHQNPKFFLKYELANVPKLQLIGTDTFNARFSSNHKPDLVEQVWRHLRATTRSVHRDLRLNALFPKSEIRLTEEYFDDLLDKNMLPAYPTNNEQAAEIFRLLKQVSFTKEQEERQVRYNKTQEISFCIAAAETAIMHCENVRLASESKNMTGHQHR